MIRRILNPFVGVGIIALTSISAFAGSVTLKTPTNGSSVTSPVAVSATASSSRNITGTKIYLDGNAVWSGSGASISAAVTASVGTHKLTVRAWDASGAYFSTVSNVTVTAGSGGTTTIPSNATTYTHIEDMSGWDGCTDCAGGGANAIYSMTQHIGSPSLDGSSAKFFLGGTTPFSHGLWWQHMGTSSTATHFVLDMYYMIDKPANSQGLEFAANHLYGGGWYKFSTQCGFSNGLWRAWDSKNSAWVSLGIPCVRPAANTWQHVIFEYQRTGGKAVFVAITVNGERHYVNKGFYPQPKSSNNSIGIHFQLDGDSKQDDYTVWADKMSFYYW